MEAARQVHVIGQVDGSGLVAAEVVADGRQRVLSQVEDDLPDGAVLTGQDDAGRAGGHGGRLPSGLWVWSEPGRSSGRAGRPGGQ